MAATPKYITPVQLGTGATTIHTVTALKTAIVKELIIFNSHTAALSVSLYFVPNGGSASATNQIFAQSLDASSTTILSLNTVLEAGALVQGLAGTGAKVSVRASVVEF